MVIQVFVAVWWGTWRDGKTTHVYVFVLCNNSVTCGLSKIFVLEASKGGFKLLPAVLMLMH